MSGNPMTPQQRRDALSEARGLLLGLREIIVADIGAPVFDLVIACLTAQRDRIPAEGSAMAPFRKGET